MENNNRKKIMFLITKSNWGGAQRYVYDLATNLDKNKYEPVVALGGDGTLKDMLDANGVRVVLIAGLQRDFSLWKEIFATLSVASLIRKEDPDILHVNSSKAGFIGAFLGRILFVPRVIFTAHGWAFNEQRPFYQRLAIKFLHWLTVVFAHHTIAVSNGLREQMNWYAVQDRMTVINPGRTITDMKSKDEARNQLAGFVPRLESYKNDFWLGTIAELHPIKRLDVGIKSMSELIKTHPDLRYIIIGSGELRQKLEAQINTLNLNDHVFLAGAITEAGKLNKAFDLFVLPSASESYGYVLLEAGAASLPVVASNVGGIPDIIENEKSGLLVEPGNEAALTQAISKIINNPSLQEELGAVLFKTTSLQTVARMTKETEAIYEGTNSRT